MSEERGESTEGDTVVKSKRVRGGDKNAEAGESGDEGILSEDTCEN